MDSISGESQASLLPPAIALVDKILCLEIKV
jgi:hypothetical protein